MVYCYLTGIAVKCIHNWCSLRIVLRFLLFNVRNQANYYSFQLGFVYKIHIVENQNNKTSKTENQIISNVLSFSI